MCEMHSAKFPSKVKHLKQIVSGKHLRALWNDVVRDHMRRQIVPDPVEFLDFHLQAKQRCDELEVAICTGKYLPNKITRLTSEKSKGLCRQIVLPTPEDALVLQALSSAIWKEVRNKAPHDNAFFEPNDQPFSKVKFLEDEWGYGPMNAWIDFQEEILYFSKSHKYLVVTDIANYYDSIIHNYLRSILAEYANEKESALDLLLFILDQMLWRPDYMPNYGIGLPQMDQDAPRLLAHTHLFEIDELFASNPSIDYARYMDDMDFGVDSIAQAKTILRDLDLALQTRNLRLNNGKTKILSSSEALKHFRADDNYLISILKNKIEKYGHLKKFKLRYGKFVSMSISKGLKTGRFDGGSGDKILKQLITLARTTTAVIDKNSFKEILFNWPSIRQNLFSYLSHSDNHYDYHEIILEFLASGESVDDLSKVLIATAFTGALFPTKFAPGYFNKLMANLDKTKTFDLFARLWLKSRFGSLAELKSEIDSTKATWTGTPFLLRTVAGVYGLFRGNPSFAAYEAYVRRWGGPESIALMDFEETLASDKRTYGQVRSFVAAENSSAKLRTTHSKMLMLATMMSNPPVAKIDKAKLLATKSIAMSDIYYQEKFSAIISNTP